MTTATTPANPLLAPSDLPYGLPRFTEISPAQYEQALIAGMAAQRDEIEAIAADPAEPTFDNTLVAMERTGRSLDRAARAFYLVSSADGGPEMEAVDERVAPLLAAHSDAIYLDRRLFARVDTLHRRRDELGLDAIETHLLDRYHTRFVRAGANLDDAGAARLTELNADLAGLYTEFGNTVRAATKGATVDIHDVADLDGMSANAIETARANAEDRDAPYAISLMHPTAQPTLAMLSRRDIRERIHRASVDRASDGGEHDTRDLIRRIVTARAERAALLGYPHHAAYQISDNTAGSAEAVLEMLERLAPAAVANARQEAADLQAEMGEGTLAPWDWSFYSERVQRSRYGIDEAEIRPYLELDRVLIDGVFYAATRLYGITFTERTDLPGYHEDVRAFEVFEADGSPLGLFLADYYTRPTKSGGAWMTSLATPNDIDGTRPVVTNNLNVTKPPAGQPTLLTLDEVRTMFHEFGHALHGLFGAARWPIFSGTASKRDFVEFPSQVNEVWMLEPEVLSHYAKHVETGAPLPSEVVDRLNESSAFNEGYKTTEYLAAALLDLAWHTLAADQAPTDVLAFETDALERNGVALDLVPPRYRSAYFTHAFAGDGYSAGYYVYIWSEILDADTVAWFRENGGLTRDNGDRYRYELLGRCGSADPLAVYRAFRGGEPDVAHLLARRRLATAS